MTRHGPFQPFRQIFLRQVFWLARDVSIARKVPNTIVHNIAVDLLVQRTEGGNVWVGRLVYKVDLKEIILYIQFNQIKMNFCIQYY